VPGSPPPASRDPAPHPAAALESEPEARRRALLADAAAPVAAMLRAD